MYNKNLMLGNTLSSVANASLTATMSVAVFLVLLALAWRTSKGMIISFVLGMIISGAVFQTLLNTTFYSGFILKQPQSFFINTGIYSVLVLFITFSMRRFIHESFAGSFWLKMLQMITMAVIAEGILFVHLYKILDIGKQYSFSPFFTMLFGSEYSFLSWFAVLLVGLLIIRNNK